MKTIETTIAFLLKDDQILLGLQKRGHGQGRWNGAGGKLEPNETTDQAMIRECQEEIGVTPEIYKKVGFINFIVDFDGLADRVISHVYTCDRWSGQPTETEEMEPRWYKSDSLPYDQMWPDDKLWLPQVLAGKIIDAKFEYNPQMELIDHSIRYVKEL